MKQKQLSKNIKIAEELRARCNKLSKKERVKLLKTGLKLINANHFSVNIAKEI